MKKYWQIVFGNYFPREVDSTWSSKKDAEKRLKELEEKSTMWEIEECYL